jgi:CheY-like chemotaxis protein
MVFDVQLGGMSGIELAQVLAATEIRRAPVIYITAHDDPETRRQRRGRRLRRLLPQERLRRRRAGDDPPPHGLRAAGRAMHAVRQPRLSAPRPVAHRRRVRSIASSHLPRWPGQAQPAARHGRAATGSRRS